MDPTLHEIELQILQALALVVGAAAIFALKKAASWLGLKLQADQVAMLNSAVDKAMTLGVTKADSVITAKGWDHVDSKNAVLSYAVNTIEDNFEGTLKANGIDLTNQGDKARLLQMMERMWPDIATRMSDSPVTPPTPQQTAAVIVAQPPASAPNIA